ncbi:MAG TPA: archaemetzincin family Zn-dependent metalloprotease [Conexivisphaerales archaeon]|nr:archaemetzincin family Zn-dependent metalloprotease [Conexivisphaerales archaeon]
MKSKGTITFVSLGGLLSATDAKPFETAAGVFDLRANFLPTPSPLEESELNAARKQYDAALILKRLEGLVKAGGSNFVVGVTEKDIFVQGSNYVFGLADPQRSAGVVSLARLRINSNPRLLSERTMKEAAHEIGHLVGLKHCPEPTCIMSFANSTFDVDSKLPMLCKECLAQIGVKF